MSWAMLAAPVSLINRMPCSTLVNGTFAGGEVDDPSDGDPSDGARCGADPTDPRGRSSRAELLGLLAGFSSSSPALSLTDESGLKGLAGCSSDDVESSVSTSSDKDDLLG